MKKDNEYCIGCGHYRNFYENLNACHYCFDTGNLRGCQAGKGCKHYTKEKFCKQKFDQMCLKF